MFDIAICKRDKLKYSQWLVDLSRSPCISDPAGKYKDICFVIRKRKKSGWPMSPAPTCQVGALETSGSGHISEGALLQRKRLSVLPRQKDGQVFCRRLEAGSRPAWKCRPSTGTRPHPGIRKTNLKSFYFYERCPLKKKSFYFHSLTSLSLELVNQIIYFSHVLKRQGNYTQNLCLCAHRPFQVQVWEALHLLGQFSPQFLLFMAVLTGNFFLITNVRTYGSLVHAAKVWRREAQAWAPRHLPGGGPSGQFGLPAACET